MKKCPEVYQENGQQGEFITDNIEHDFSIIYHDGEFSYRICSHCKGKEYPKG